MRGIKKEALLYDMLWYIQNKKEFTAQELADQFQLSVRSIYRYISDLADLGLYIESKKGRNGGFSVLENQILPPVLFTENELFSLYFAIQSLADYGDFPFKVNTITAREKLVEVVSKSVQQKLLKLSDHFRIAVPKQAVSTPYLNELITAALDYQVVRIEYHSIKKVSKKTIEPIGIYASNGLWYLFALDQTIKEARHFRIDRIKKLEITEEYFEPSIRLKEIETEYLPQKPLKLVAHLSDKGAKQCLENRYLHSGVQKNETGGSELSMSISQSDIEFTAEFFLLLGKEAQVKEPAELVMLLKEKIEELRKLYN